MKLGEYDISLSPLGWLALAAGAALSAVGPGRGFKREGNSQMAHALHVYIVPEEEGGKVQIEHVFYGETKEECRELFEGHQHVCKNFGPAVADGRTAEEWEEIDEDEIPEIG